MSQVVALYPALDIGHVVALYSAFTIGHVGGKNFSGRGVRYWEIWNEPDSSCDWSNASTCGRFWNRTASEFFSLVDKAARAIKVGLYNENILNNAGR